MKHLNICKQVLFNPKEFFSNLPKGEWHDEALSFLGINAFILAFFSTLIVFLNQYVPMGSLLITGISGVKLLTILPVVATLAFNFFVFTFLITGGLMLFGFTIIFLAAAAVIHFLIKPRDNTLISEMIKASCYSSAVIIIGAIPVLSLFLVKKGLFTFSNFVITYYLFYFCLAVGLFWLLNLAAVKFYDASRTKIFIAVLIPIAILILMGGFFGLKILPKLAPLIS